MKRAESQVRFSHARCSSDDPTSGTDLDEWTDLRTKALETIDEDVEPEAEEANPTRPKGTRAPVVVDRGYAWVIVAASFMSNLLLGGLDSADGIFYLAFLKRFEESAQITAWPVAVVAALRLTTGPLAVALSTRYSVRASCMLGSTLVFAGFVCTAFSTNILAVFFSFAVLQGFGRGFVFTPSFLSVAMYFHKKRGMASGISGAGAGVGTFLLVPLVHFLFEEYGFMGAFLIMGAICSNMYVIGMLYRPLGLHHKIVRARAKRKFKPEIETTDIKIEDNDKTQENISKSNNIDNSHTSAASITTKDSKTSSKSQLTVRSFLETIFPVDVVPGKSRTTSRILDLRLLRNPAFAFYCLNIFTFTIAYRIGLTFIPALLESNGLTGIEAASVVSIAGAADTMGRMSIGFLLDRPCISPMRPAIYNSIQIFIVVCAFLFPSTSTFAEAVGVACLHTIATGVYNSQRNVIVIDIVGMTNMAPAFGILLFFQGVGMLLGPPVSGLLKDRFGTYDMAFYMGGICAALAMVFMTISNVHTFTQRKRRGTVSSMFAFSESVEAADNSKTKKPSNDDNNSHSSPTCTKITKHKGAIRKRYLHFDYREEQRTGGTVCLVQTERS